MVPAGLPNVTAGSPTACFIRGCHRSAPLTCFFPARPGAHGAGSNPSVRCAASSNFPSPGLTGAPVSWETLRACLWAQTLFYGVFSASPNKKNPSGEFDKWRETHRCVWRGLMSAPCLWLALRNVGHTFPVKLHGSLP